jgi:hypothetical protein
VNTVLSGFRAPTSRALRIAFIVIATLALLALTLQKSIAAVLRGPAPEIALKLDGSDARAAAGVAFKMLVTNPSAANSKAIWDMARDSLARDPTVVPAARTLGLVADLKGRPQQAERFFRYAQRTSARDLPTQLWLIERAVAREDVPGAISHFDTALRTNRSAAGLLLPILVNATEDPVLVPHIRDVLIKRPAWSEPYLRLLVANGKSIMGASAVIEYLLRNRVPVHDEVVWSLVNRHTESGDFAAGWRVYALRNPKARPDAVRFPAFENESGPLPFEWWLASEADRSADRIDAAHGRNALEFRAGSAVSGVVARQVLLMRPGMRYRLHGIVGQLNHPRGSRPFWRVSCQRDNRFIADLTLPAAAETPAPFSVAFQIPPNCDAQKLELVIRPSDEVEGVSGSLLRVSVDKASG